MKLLLLARYGDLGASSRLRLLQYLPILREQGWSVEVQTLIDDELLSGKYATGKYDKLKLCQAYRGRIRYLYMHAHEYNVLWIEKEALPWLPSWLERWLLRNRPYVLDFDDAVFHNYDRHRLKVIRNVFGRRIDKIMTGSAMVTAGNSYLAQRAHAAGVRHVKLIPTVIDIKRYPKTEKSFTEVKDSIPRIVWIGSPSTVHYLQQLSQSLISIAKSTPFILRVIGANFELPSVNVELLPWSEATEAFDISVCDIGIMPLLETPWELGKCGYKIIQYMACGLPVVVSPVGANNTIVTEGTHGYFAADTAAWERKLRILLADADLRHRMGENGRLRVEEIYSLQQVGPKLVTLLRGVEEINTCAA